MQSPGLQTPSLSFTRFLEASTQTSISGHKEALAPVDDLSLGINAQLVFRAANTADFSGMPELTQCLFVSFAGAGDLQFFEVVLSAVGTGLRPRDSLGASLGNC